MNGTYQNNGYGTVDTDTNTNMNNNHVVTINKSGSEGAYITLKNYPGHSPLIQFDGRGGIVISNNMNYIIIEGFEVVGPGASITYAEAYADREYMTNKDKWSVIIEVHILSYVLFFLCFLFLIYH